jgi:hypothetical protein
MRAGGLIALVAVTTACGGFDPTYPIGIACGDGRECPPGQACSPDDRCYPEGQLPDAVVVPTCPSPAQPLLPKPSFVAATLDASAPYTPSCTPGVTGPESFWSIDLDAPAPHPDLVVDVEDQVGDTGVGDAVIEVSRGCSPDTVLACVDASIGGAGEVAVVPDIGAGRTFVVVDSGPAAVAGLLAYRIRAWTRPVIDDHAPCDFTLIENRCADGLACVDTAGETRCAALPAQTEGDSNESCAGTTTKVTGDAILTGLVSHADHDVIELAPPAAANLRVHLYGPSGGCTGDLKLSLADAACTFEGAGDDDNGLGGCTYFAHTDTLDPAAKHYLEIAAFDSVNVPVPYTIVIDFDWH